MQAQAAHQKRGEQLRCRKPAEGAEVRLVAQALQQQLELRPKLALVAIVGEILDEHPTQ
jgi:hypothetical protein